MGLSNPISNSWILIRRTDQSQTCLFGDATRGTAVRFQRVDKINTEEAAARRAAAMIVADVMASSMTPTLHKAGVCNGLPVVCRMAAINACR